MHVTFDTPQLAIATGQGAAFYLGDRLVGGGWIESTQRVSGTLSREAESLAER